MKVTRYGRSIVGQFIGWSPDAPTGDAPTPDDVAPESTVEIPVHGTTAFAFVQSGSFSNASTDSGISVTLAATPTIGNLLVAAYTPRENSGIDPTLAGWTVLPTSDGVDIVDGGGGDNGGIYLFYKLAGASESATVTVSKNASVLARLAVVEFGGQWTFEDSNSESTTSTVSSLGTNSITPAGAVALLVGLIAQSNESDLTIGGGFTPIDEGMTGTDNDFGPTHLFGYRHVDPPSGSYEMTATSNVSDSYAGIIAGFESASEVTSWIPAPLTKDADDATFDYVSDASATAAGAILRLDVGTAQRFASFRLVIGLASGGSVEYTLEADDNEDFTSPATIVAVTFTATGSFTADTVTASWSQSTGYRYYRLVPTTPDDVRIYTFSLFPSPDPGEALDDHLTDAVDAHDATAISFTPAGTIAATNVQAAIEEVASEAGGGTPATTVENETTYGISPAVGTDTEYARQDHTHGTPAVPDLDDLGDVNAPTPSDGDVLAWDSTPGEWVPVAPGSPTIDWGEDADISTLDYDDVADAGVLDEVARADHVHGMPSAGGGGAGSAAAIDRWHISAYASTNSYNTTITAASVGQRIIYVVASYARDVNTPTCTNVTFTEVLGVNNSTNCYLSIYIGVVAGGSSGTTINVTSGSANYQFATAIIIDEAVTPTVVDSASATTANTVMAVDCSVGDLIIMGWATDNATNGPTHPHPLEATSPLWLGPIDNTDNLNNAYVAVGLATITHVVGYFGRGGSGNQVGGIVAVS